MKWTASLTSTIGAVRALVSSAALVAFAQPKPDKATLITLGIIYTLTSFLVSLAAGDEPRNNRTDDRQQQS